MEYQSAFKKEVLPFCGPVSKTLRSKAGGMGSIPDQRMPQLRVYMLQLKILCAHQRLSKAK